MPYEESDLQGTGKRKGGSLIAATGTSSGTISIKDTISGKLFLVDSGADECVFPAGQADLSLPRLVDLVAANGSNIKTFGKRRIRVAFSGGHSLVHSFWIATVNRPILGADFFRDHKLVIDVANHVLISSSGAHLPAVPTSRPSVFGLRLPTRAPFESILEEFPDLLTQNFHGDVRHKVRHHIPTTGPPLHARPRCLEGEKMRVAQEEFNSMEKMGIK